MFLLSGGLVSFDSGKDNIIPDSSVESPNSVPERNHFPSDHFEGEGSLDPVLIEQRGNGTTPTLHAETDSGSNVITNLTLDRTNDWVGSRATVNLWNLERLYVENGSLTEGTIDGTNDNPTGGVAFHPYGWDATSGSPDPSMNMIAAYADQQISVTANGYGGGGNYFYANGTYIYWTQSVNNSPYLEDFLLDFDYYFAPQGSLLEPNATVVVYIDDRLVWSNSTAEFPSSIWQNSGTLQVNLAGIGSQFEFKVGLYINQSFFHDKQKVQFIFDNLRFVGATSPTFDDAGITFSIAQSSQLVAGTSIGEASISNASLWQKENVLVELGVSLGYSFDYTATMLSHRYVNSSKSLSLLDYGVHYMAQANNEPQFDFYTFIGALPDLDDFSLYIRLPTDWENVTVFNPFGTDVTALCSVIAGMVLIPNSLVSTLGWWQIQVDAPNYARSVQTLKHTGPPTDWVQDTVFRSTNITMPSIEIGSTQPLPGTLQDVNITWVMPNNTIWFTEVISGGINGAINGSQLEFGPTNATAGIWEVYVVWTNGTEVAFGGVNFNVYHGTTLTPMESTIETKSGELRSAFVYFEDSETGDLIIDPSASITANWSSTTVTFNPDPVLNRWFGSFDTSLVGAGSNLVVVNASLPYYDDVSCTFTINIVFSDNALVIDNSLTEIGFGDTFVATFSYSDLYGVGIAGATVNFSFTGFPGGLVWDNLIDYGDGNYSVEITGVHADLTGYELKISASKAPYYEAGEDSLVIIVGPKTSFLTIENGTAVVVGFGEDYRLVLRYSNGSDYGLDGANVSIHSSIPSTNISYGVIVNEGSGYYSVILTPEISETFTLYIEASFQDHRTQLVSFTITATAISTQLRVSGVSSPSVVGVAEPFEFLIFYERVGSVTENITGAFVNVTFTSLRSLDYNVTPLSEGYRISLDTSQIGSYEFSIYVIKPGFQDDFETFTLFIQAREMEVVMASPIWTRRQNLEINLQLVDAITRTPITGANVTYWLVRSGGIIDEGRLSEVPGAPGNYSLSIMPDWLDGTGYSIHIFAAQSNYQLYDEYEFPISQYTPPGIILEIMVETYGPPIGLLAAVSVVSVAGRSYYRRKRKAEFATDLANQRRFDDTDNIIGVIVMHKLSGIPIFSRIVKGGFEEGIVAAFISAVTTFRDEFEVMDEEAMTAIPISDIIRAVQTPNLICAFVTVQSASMEHNRKIEAFSREISRYLDDFYMDSKPPSTLDPRIAEIVDYVFDETMDGVLIKYHKLGSAKIPKRYVSIEQVLLDADSNLCSKPVNLARALSKYGIPEARGCTIVSEAIEKEIIVPCEKDEYPESDFDLHSFLNDK
jgi:hypothetical protein